MFSPDLKNWGTPPPPTAKVVAKPPMSGPPLTFSPALKCWGPLKRHRLCSPCPDLWAIVAPPSPPARRGWGPLRRHVLCSQSTHLRATANFLLHSKVLGTSETPQLARGTTNLPTGVPLPGFSPTLKLCGIPRQQGLCSHSAQVWATANLLSHSKTLESPQTARVLVANVPSSGPLLTLSRTLKRLGPLRRQALCCPLGHLWAIVHFCSRMRWHGLRRQSAYL